MSRKENIEFNCPKCNDRNSTIIYSSIHCDDSEEVKLIEKDLLNIAICKSCNTKIRIPISVMYHKAKEKFAIWYVPVPNETINDSNREAERILGSQSYLANVAEIKEWAVFKKIVLDFEKGLVEKQQLAENQIKNLSDFIEYHSKYTLEIRPGDIRCQKCGTYDLISTMRGDCRNCKNKIPYYCNTKILHLAFLTFYEFLLQYDEQLGKDAKNKIVLHVKTVLTDMEQNLDNEYRKIDNSILTPILEMQFLGGEKVGGVIKFGENPEMQLFEKNGMYKTSAAQNLSVLILAYEFVKKYKMHNVPKTKWWEFWK